MLSDWINFRILLGHKYKKHDRGTSGKSNLEYFRNFFVHLVQGSSIRLCRDMSLFDPSFEAEENIANF